MPVHIIIDGYNLIRQSKALQPIDQNDLQLGREALIDKLSAYKRLKGHQITVVFDGSGQFSPFETTSSEKGIRIKFSRHGQSADDVIKQMAAHDREKALVVSSDHELARFCTTHGATVVSSAELEEKMEMAVAMNIKGDTSEPGDGNGWIPTTKKKGQGKRLSKQKRKNQKRLMKL